MFKIAVVTPYYKESIAILKQCHDSVRNQTIEADHFMIADGFANSDVAAWNVQHVALPKSHADNGNTPRQIGSVLADAQGYDFIAYLDADNWFHPTHLSSLIDLHLQTKAPVCASFRTFHDLDGELLEIFEVEEDRFEHIDTSCFLIHRSAFSLANVWVAMPKALSPVCDRVFFAAVKKHRFAVASSQQRTVAFRSQYEVHYTQAGRQPPPGYKPADCLAASQAFMMSKAGVDECFNRLGFWPATFV